MIEHSQSDRVCIDVVNTEGLGVGTSVSKTALSQASDFFESLFKYTQPRTCFDANGDAVPHYELHVVVKDVAFVGELLLYAGGKSLQLTERNIAIALLIGDMWSWDGLLHEIVTFIKGYLCSVLSIEKAISESADVSVGLHRIVQVFTLFSMAAEYGMHVESMPEITALHDGCVDWMAACLPSILLCRKTGRLSDAILQQAISRVKTGLKPQNCVQLWKRYRACVTRLDLASKPKNKAIARDICNRAMETVVYNFSEVVSMRTFDSFMRPGWNKDFVLEFRDCLIESLKPDTGVSVLRALESKVKALDVEVAADMDRGSVSRHDKQHEKVASLQIQKDLLESIRRYCQKHLMAIMRSRAYKELSKSEQGRLTRRLKAVTSKTAASIDRENSKRTQGCSFVVLS